MTFVEHCHALANKGFFRLYLLRCFHSHNYELKIKLFNCFVRFILEYNSPVWSAHLKHYIATID